MKSENQEISINHLGIIMDGNSRWAQQNNLPLHIGHKRGAENAKKIIELAAKYNVKHISLFAFSTENWKRPPSEVSYLLLLLEDYLTNQLQTLISNKIKLLVVGDTSNLSDKLKNKIQEINQIQLDNPTITVYLIFSYGGKKEILDAVNRLIQEPNIGHISETDFKKFLYIPEMPDLDLVIRTGNNKRISNFLLWHIAYAELYFLEKYWPDFNEQDLQTALTTYSNSIRTFGQR